MICPPFKRTSVATKPNDVTLRTLAIGKRITVCLVSSLSGLYSRKKENMLLCAESKLVKLETRRTVILAQL